MISIFSNMIENGMKIFMDDFSILGSTYDECLEILGRVLERYESFYWFGTMKNIILWTKKELCKDAKFQAKNWK